MAIKNLINFKILKFIFCIFICISLPAIAEITPIDKVIAIVNDDVILGSQLQERINAFYIQAKQQGQSVPSVKYVAPQILERLILESIQLQLAEKAGVKIPEDELSSTINKIANQNGISVNDLKQKIIIN